jgi:CRP/FNR family transcriptional regulator, cyclic AMP receptor protein
MKIADLLDGLDLFKDFAYPELETIGGYLQLEEVAQGTVIFNEGDPGSYMFILVNGRISIFKGGENGGQLLSHETPGRIVGEMSLLDQELRSATCVADTDCELLSLTSENLKKFSVTQPFVAYRFMFCLARLLSRRLRRVSGMMADLLGN